MEKQMFEELLESVKEVKNIIDGKVQPSRRFLFEEPNPKEIRAKLKLTQDQLANLMNISVHTLRNWEQGRRHPEGPARVLLNLVNNHPEILMAWLFIGNLSKFIIQIYFTFGNKDFQIFIKLKNLDILNSLESEIIDIM